MFLTFLQKPDIELDNGDLISGDNDHNAHYEFHGNGGGEYNLDTRTGEKSINYSGRSDITNKSDVMKHLLSKDKLKDIAVQYMRLHYPGYKDGMFKINAPPVDYECDLNEYTVFFRMFSKSGAMLPTNCVIYIEENTGKLFNYNEEIVPITINTTPVFTEEQAVQIGKIWIAMNFSADQPMGEFNTDLGGAFPVKFEVVKDNLDEQVLHYQISYKPFVLDIDAITGDVYGLDYYAMDLPRTKTGPLAVASKRESFLRVPSKNPGAPSNRMNISVNGHIYIWSGYLKHMGLSFNVNKKEMTIKSDKKSVILPISDLPEDGKAAWMRQKNIYMPLKILNSLTGRL